MGAHVPVDPQRNALGKLPHGEVGAQVVRDRVETAGMHEPCPGLPRTCVVPDVHQVDELGLTGEVDVVGTGVRAGGHQFLAVRDVRPDRRGHHARVVGEFAQRRRIGHVRVKDTGDTGRSRGAGDTGGFGQPLPQPLQLLQAAPGDRPPQPLGRVRGEVLRGERPDEPRGSEEHDVVRAIRVIRPVQPAHDTPARDPASRARSAVVGG